MSVRIKRNTRKRDSKMSVRIKKVYKEEKERENERENQKNFPER